MKLFKTSSITFVVIFMIGALFIWFRETDGSGAPNSLLNQLISLCVWVFLFIFVLIAHLVWHHFIVKKTK